MKSIIKFLQLFVSVRIIIHHFLRIKLQQVFMCLKIPQFINQENSFHQDCHQTSKIPFLCTHTNHSQTIIKEWGIYTYVLLTRFQRKMVYNFRQLRCQRLGMSQYLPLIQIFSVQIQQFVALDALQNTYFMNFLTFYNIQFIEMEFFGYNQKSLCDQDWIDIGKKMLNSPYVRLKNIQYLAEAEHQGERFARMGTLTGAILFVAFLKFPLIRIQPGFRRVGLSGILAYPFYSYMNGLATKLKVKRIKYAYRKQLVQHKGHLRVTV